MSCTSQLRLAVPPTHTVATLSEHEADSWLQVTSLDLQNNVVAAYVSGSKAHELPAVMKAMRISSQDSFEIGFNNSICSVDGNYIFA